jgi:hypothetical protein
LAVQGERLASLGRHARFHYRRESGEPCEALLGGMTSGWHAVAERPGRVARRLYGVGVRPGTGEGVEQRVQNPPPGHGTLA